MISFIRNLYRGIRWVHDCGEQYRAADDSVPLSFTERVKSLSDDALVNLKDELLKAGSENESDLLFVSAWKGAHQEWKRRKRNAAKLTPVQAREQIEKMLTEAEAAPRKPVLTLIK